MKQIPMKLKTKQNKKNTFSIKQRVASPKQGCVSLLSTSDKHFASNYSVSGVYNTRE